MTTWILIVLAVGRGSAVSLATIPGFSTQEECMVAGSIGVTMKKNENGVDDYRCVRQTQAKGSRK